MQHLLFIDESGDHGLTYIDPNFPVFVLCGIMFENAQYQKFREILNEFKNDFWGSKEVILHSRDIRKCEREFSILFDLKLKENFYEKLNKIIKDAEFKIISVAINKEEYIKKYGKLSKDPYEISLSFLIERSIFYLDSRRQKSLKIIIEKRGKKEDTSLNSHFNRIHSNGTYYLNKNRMKQYDLTVEFKSKIENINGLQLADLIAYPIAKHVIKPESVNFAFDLIEDKIYTNRQRMHGIKVFP